MTMTHEQTVRAAIRQAMKKNAGGSLQSAIADWMRPMIKGLTKDLEKLTGLEEVNPYNDPIPSRVDVGGMWGEYKVTIYVDYAIGSHNTHRDIFATIGISGLPKSRNATFDFGFEMSAEEMTRPILEWVEKMMASKDEAPKKAPVRRR